MASSYLGLYIEDNLIKYAKVSKSNDAIKVESFGIKFYDNLEATIKQIVEETYSYGIPISVNLNSENYNKFEVFSLLTQKDMDGVINTEFENYCYDNDLNKNMFEQRYIFTSNNNSNSEKLKVLHVSAQKTAIAQIKNQFSKYKVSNISPIGLTIPNIGRKDKKATNLFVNIEGKTTITKVINNTISDVNVLPIGAKNILDSINRKENSYSKSYEICKGTTIYTDSDKDLQYEENEYLEDIMPILFQIVTEVKKTVDESLENIENVYITGIAAIINNIDIYFQEFLRNIHCEILRPVFINNNSKINIKDYIEVNSAISIALQGIDKGTINFTKQPFTNKLMIALNKDISKKSVGKNSNDGFTNNIDDFLEKFSKQYNIAGFSFGFLLILYIGAMITINSQLKKKMSITEESIRDTTSRIAKIEEYNTKFNNQITEYQRLISNIENLNDANSEDKRYKNTIPNLLNNIMTVIPKGVQLTSIENTSNTHIVIGTKSDAYRQAAFFKAKLKTEGILKEVVSDTGTVQNEGLVVTIEGELP